MIPTLFFPTPRQFAILAVLIGLALAYAFYLRFAVIQDPDAGFACASVQSWFCNTRRVVLTLFMQNVFGWTALVAAVVNLWRPSVLITAVALLAAAFGLVLFNVQLAALAVTLVLFSLARRAPEPE